MSEQLSGRTTAPIVVHVGLSPYNTTAPKVVSVGECLQVRPEECFLNTAESCELSDVHLNVKYEGVVGWNSVVNVCKLYSQFHATCRLLSKQAYEFFQLAMIHFLFNKTIFFYLCCYDFFDSSQFGQFRIRKIQTFTATPNQFSTIHIDSELSLLVYPVLFPLNQITITLKNVFVVGLIPLVTSLLRDEKLSS